MFSRNTLYFLGVGVLLAVCLLAGKAVYPTDFPGGYHLLESENFWDAELLQHIECRQKQLAGKSANICNKQVIPPTIVDYALRKEYLLVLKADRDAHFSNALCGSCLQQAVPCVVYWIVNTQSHELTGPLNKDSFGAFLLEKGIRPVLLEYKLPDAAKQFCMS